MSEEESDYKPYEEYEDNEIKEKEMNHSTDCIFRVQEGIRHHGDPVRCECNCDCHECSTDKQKKKLTLKTC